MSEHPPIKVGDKLAYQDHYSRKWRICKVEKITPSGRIKCGLLELNPDLVVRGRGESWSKPYRLEVATPEILAAAHRSSMIDKITRFEKWSALTSDQLETIMTWIERSGDE